MHEAERSKTKRDVQEDLGQVLLLDPFSETTKKSKRNLLVSSFLALLIGILHLKISGFLGLRSESQDIGNEVTLGIAFFVTAYFLTDFCLRSYMDYSIWTHMQEKIISSPFFQMVPQFELRINNAGKKIEHALFDLKKFSIDGGKVAEDADKISNELRSVGESLKRNFEEMIDIEKLWRSTLATHKNPNLQIKARKISVLALDVGLPIILGAIALLVSISGVPFLVRRVLS